MNKYYIKKSQLLEYVDLKKSHNIYMKLLNELYIGTKNIKDADLLKHYNQTILDNYNRKNLLSKNVLTLLKENNLIDNNNKIL